MNVLFLRTYKDRKRILITGGAGFVGSHLVDKLMLDGHEVNNAFFSPLISGLEEKLWRAVSLILKGDHKQTLC